MTFAVWFLLACLAAFVLGWLTGDYGGAGELVGAALVVVVGWWASLQRRMRKAAWRRINEREPETALRRQLRDQERARAEREREPGPEARRL